MLRLAWAAERHPAVRKEMWNPAHKGGNERDGEMRFSAFVHERGVQLQMQQQSVMLSFVRCRAADHVLQGAAYGRASPSAAMERACHGTIARQVEYKHAPRTDRVERCCNPLSALRCTSLPHTPSPHMIILQKHQPQVHLQMTMLAPRSAFWARPPCWRSETVFTLLVDEDPSTAGSLVRGCRRQPRERNSPLTQSGITHSTHPITSIILQTPLHQQTNNPDQVSCVLLEGEEEMPFCD
jgi:hypothetical protein